METQIAVQSSAHMPLAADRSRPSTRVRVVLRFIVAAAASAALSLTIWSFVPTKLSIKSDIVGYPTYFDFNYARNFWAYRLAIFVFPVFLIGFHALLARFGPLRRVEGVTPRDPIRVVEPAPRSMEDAAAGNLLGVVLRLGIPTGLVVGVASARTGRLDVFAFACGVVYLLAVLLAAALLMRLATELRFSLRASGFWRAVAWANGVGGSLAAVLGLWFVSRYTLVFSPEGAKTRWSWMPLWLAALGVLAVAGWAISRYRRGASARTVERTLLVYVVGSIALFLALSRLPYAGGFFHGFDDAQDLVGASLLERGYLPWRDQLFIHGVFPDIFVGNFGMAIFGDSIWGVLAGALVLLLPLCWVAVYLFAAWISRGNPWFVAALGVLAVGGLVVPQVRFLFAPLALIVLGETIRRMSAGWCVGLVLILFAQAIVTPETGFLAIPALACVVAADIVHRDPGLNLWQNLRRTRWCVATGCAAVLLVAVGLAAVGALGAFIDYYVIFGPGHNLAGALPLRGLPAHYFFRWAAGGIVVLITIWATVARVRRRGDWTPLDWVALAASGFVALYAEKALGRYDQHHVDQVFIVALPLILLWSWRGLSALNGLVRSLQRPSLSAVSAFAAAFVVVVLLFDGQLLKAFRGMPAQHRITAATDPTYARLDYASPVTVNRERLKDLDLVLRTYAGENGPVFDMTNGLGYVYYLLGRDPGTRFTHISMAIPAYSQQILIDELRRSKPPVVIFESGFVGLPRWDYIENNVRHYMVSQYILDGWVPVLRTQENLFLVRRDLVSQGLPQLPALSEPASTTDLWFSGTSCDWGTSPNFLVSQPAGVSLSLPVRAMGKRKFVQVTGWATDTGTGLPAREVVLVSEGKVVASIIPSIARPDVTRLQGANAYHSGFKLSGLMPESGKYSLYMVASDGTLHPLAASTPAEPGPVGFPDGRVVPVAAKTMGVVESAQTVERTVGEVEIPGGSSFAYFDLATISAGDSPLGPGAVAITDDLGQRTHYINAEALPRFGSSMAIRVGSCLQWQAYDSARPLYVVQDGGAPATTMTLSGVGG